MKKADGRFKLKCLTALSVALSVALVAASSSAVVMGVRTAELTKELKGVSGKLSKNQSELERMSSKLSEADRRLAEYREQISSLSAANKEQLEQLEQLTAPLNGRDERTPEPTDAKIAYLTFDDGPSSHTDRILKILSEKEAVATFFVINTGYFDKINDILKQGSAVAIHSYTHQYSKIYSSVDAYFDDLHAIEDKIYAKSGIKPTILRLPGGSSNTVSKQFSAGVVTGITKRLNAEGYTYFDWNVDSTDASKNSVPAQTLIEKVKAASAGKRVINILMHDTEQKGTTVDALPTIIDWLREQGYQFMTLSPNSTQVHHSVNN